MMDAAGVPRDNLYDLTMYILCGMLAIGLICKPPGQAVNSKMAHQSGGSRHAAGREGQRVPLPQVNSEPGRASSIDQLRNSEPLLSFRWRGESG
jgi:hypothetical protein